MDIPNLVTYLAFIANTKTSLKTSVLAVTRCLWKLFVVGDGFKLIHTKKVPDLKPVMLEDNCKMEVAH